MSKIEWLQLAARITPDRSWDLDEILPAPGPRRGGFRVLATDTPPASPLWARLSPGGTIGVRVTHPVQDAALVAARLAAAAVERDATPIILCALPLSGFEQYGFRIERLPEGPEDVVTAFEQELAAFWSLAVIINAADIASLG